MVEKLCGGSVSSSVGFGGGVCAVLLYGARDWCDEGECV